MAAQFIHDLIKKFLGPETELEHYLKGSQDIAEVERRQLEWQLKTANNNR